MSRPSSARDLYEQFRGKLARKIIKIGIKIGEQWITRRGNLNLIIPRDLAVIGHVSAIEYDAVYDGKTVKARHAFAPGARPILAVGTYLGQVYLVGNRFRFTERGFVDFNADGQMIEYVEKTGAIKRLK